MTPDFSGLLIIPSIPMLVIVYLGCLLIFGGGIAVFLLNRNVLKREQALPMVTTAGIKSPEWSLAYETPQTFYCALCSQSNISIPTKIYYSRVDPQTLLVLGVHRCPAHTAHIPAVKAPKRRKGLHKLALIGGTA
jgi:hypothetical protein